jgi:hypothetical protein
MIGSLLRLQAIVKKSREMLTGRVPRGTGRSHRGSGCSRRLRILVEELEARTNPSVPVVATSFFDGAVYEFDAETGNLLSTLVAPYSSTVLAGPAGITVGPDGNLYISSQFTNAIVKYDLTAHNLSTFIPDTVLQPIAVANGDTQFAPAGLQFGPDGNLYVSLNGGQSAVSGGAVVRLGITSNSSGLAYSGTSATIATGLVQPTGLTFGANFGDTNNLYVSNSGGDNVIKVSGAVSATPTLSEFVSGAGNNINFPSGLTWGRDGDLYVVDLGATSFQGQVVQFKPDGTLGPVVTPITPGAPGNLMLQFPSSVVFDGHGHMLTANLGPSNPPNLAGSIYQYNVGGTFVKTLVDSSQFPSTGTGKSGISPSQLVMLPPAAPVVATSFFDSAVYEIDSTSGAILSTLVAPNSSTLLSGPAGVTLGPDGNLYISSQFNNSIVKYNLTTNTLSTFLPSSVLQPIAAANGDVQFAPAGLSFGPDGNLYVSLNGGQSATSGGAVVRFGVTVGATGLTYSGAAATIATGLVQPAGLAFGTTSGDTDDLYVSNSALQDVVKVSNASSPLPASSVFIAAASGGLNFPSGLSWGPDGKLYVVDLGATSFQGNVLQFNADGSFSKIVTPTGAGQPGNLLFQFPSDVVFDGQGHMLTGNLGATYPPTLGGSINQYNTDGTFDQVLVSSAQFPNTGPGTSGIAPSQLVMLPATVPVAVASFFDGAVYDVDAITGNLLSTLVAPYSSTLLSGPAGITAGPDGNLYISSQFTNAIIKYDQISKTLSTFLPSSVLQSIAGANGVAQFAPAGLRFGPDGNLYVTLNGGQTATSGGGVVRFGITAGTAGLSFNGTTATIASGLIQPSGLTFGTAPGDTDSVYVSNSAMKSVVKISKALSANPTSSTFIAPASGGLNFPSGISWGADGKFYVVDLGATSTQGNVLQFNADGTFSKVLTPTGTGQPGNLLFQFPSDLLFDGRGHLLTANLGPKFPPSLAGGVNQYESDGTFDQALVSSDEFPETGLGTSGIAATQMTFLPVALPVAPVPSQLVISGLSPTSITAGGTVTFTVTAKDSGGNTFTGYTGTVQLTSTDNNASLNSSPLPASYTFVPADNGVHSFTVTLNTQGSSTITVTDQAHPTLAATTSPVSVAIGPFSKFVVTSPGGDALTAGTPFLVTVQATDVGGNPITNYTGPTSVTVAASPVDPQSSFPITTALSSTGLGFFVGDFQKAGAYTLTATAGTFSGTSATLTVAPLAPNYFTVNTPATATTGSPFDVTVTAFDRFGNIATGYAGSVKLTSSDPAAGLPSSYTFTTGAGKDNGVHTFNVTLKTAGSQTITATDTTSTNPTIIGTSSPITTRGLTVTALTPTATGFTVNFSEPFTVADVNLYGGSQTTPLQDVTLVGKSSGAVSGSFVVDPSGTSATFKASSIFLSTFFQSLVLPDDTWTVTLVSGTGTGSNVHGFFDSLNAPLDGDNNAGHDNYTTTFSTANGSKEVLSIPDFARGPDGANSIKVPNDSAKGIPVALSNVPAASGATDAVFTLTYNPTLLTPTGAGTGDSSGTGSTFTMGTPVSVDATHSTVTFTWHNAAAQSGTVVLGDILANVPNSAANEYKGKEILGLSQIKVNGADFTGAWANGLHVNAYFGDVTGDGKISGLDLATAEAVANGGSLGLPAFKLVDPAVVGDIAGDGSIDATAVSDLASYTSNLPTPQIPAIPTGLTITPGGPDPTLSLGQERMKDEGGRMNQTNPTHPSSFNLQPSISVMLDDPHPAGSTGMEEAVLALTLDPKVLTVSASDITLGSIPSSGTGWHLVSVVDQTTGQIGIDLYSTTPIAATQAGSLVNIVFHVVPGAGVPATAVQLVSSVTPNGRYFGTEVADDQGQYVLSPGKDRLVVETGSVASTSGFQIGTLPMLNTLLAQNNPRQLAADRLFSALAMRTDAANDAAQPNDLWLASLRDEDGNSASLFADESAVASPARHASRESVLDRLAIQAVFNRMEW